MSKNTREIALCGVFSALAIVLLCMGGIIPFAIYACPILASLVLLPVGIECRKSYAWSCYLAIAILGLLLGPDKECSLLFVFLGYYPLVKPVIEKIKNGIVQMLLKIGLFALAMCTMYAIVLFIIPIPALVAEFKTTSMILLLMMVIMGLALFLLFDRLIGILTIRYRMRRKKHF